MRPNTYVTLPRKLEHVAIVEAAIGRPLRAGEEVHHVNGLKWDNRRANVVACQDRAYHKLLESRGRALEVCGHADWLKCSTCGHYDPPAELYVGPNRRYHRSCHARYEWKRRGAKRPQRGPNGRG
jgi:hypothetical protein